MEDTHTFVGFRQNSQGQGNESSTFKMLDQKEINNECIAAKNICNV